MKYLFLQTAIISERGRSAANYDPNWPDLVQIRTFFGKEVRKKSELVNKSLIFQQKWHI